SATRTEHKQMSALGVLSNDRSHTFRQAIESAAHVRRFAGHPDPRSLRTIHRLQTWQPDHPAASTTASNARTCSASNPGLTIRLRHFVTAFFERLVMSQHCIATRIFTRWGSLSAHDTFQRIRVNGVDDWRRERHTDFEEIGSSGAKSHPAAEESTREATPGEW